MSPVTSRREFLLTASTVGGGLLLTAALPVDAKALARLAPESTNAADATLSAWVRINADDTVAITFGRTEMGQGIHTSLAMLIAEELDVAWSAVRIVQADADQAKYGAQNTGGSRSVAEGWKRPRVAGAAARQMLVGAAAARWNVPASEITTRDGVLTHAASQRTLPYGAVAAEAASQPVPTSPTLKDPSQYRIIGHDVPRHDVPLKIRGQARYGIDMTVPGMLHAVLRRCPHPGGSLVSVDDAAARAVKGVVRVERVESPHGPAVAVFATSTWAALKGANALNLTWDAGPSKDVSTATIAARFAERLAAAWRGEGDMLQVRNDGDAPTAMASASVVSGTYSAPYAPHLTMEPQNAVASVTGDRVEIWAPTQIPQGVQAQVAQALGVPAANVTVHVTFLGGGFGRRLFGDACVEAARCSRIAGAPVQVLFTREDDVRHDYFRPASLQEWRGTIAPDGTIAAVDQVFVGPAIQRQTTPQLPRTTLPFDIAQGIEEGLGQYRVPNVRQRYAPLDPGIRIGFWRSVGESQNVFIAESFMDELAHAAKADPLEFRRKHLQHKPDRLAVLDRLAKEVRWGEPLPAGRARGVAMTNWGGTTCAECVEASIENGKIRVHHVTAVVDCGRVVHPDGVRAQVEGSVIYAMGAALYEPMTFEQGAATKTGFIDYPIVRLPDAPTVTVHLMNTDRDPTGAGEPGVPPFAAALGNALFALTGQRLRSLPFRLA